jgi:hypothetical protein
MTRPPGGASAPTQALTADGHLIELGPLAREICRRYVLEFDDETERYGGTARAWCLHDNQYLLAWAIQQARDGTLDLIEQVRWLARVLTARGFPLERLARDLDIASEVAAASSALGGLAEPVSRGLAAAARVVIPTEQLG